MEWQLHHHSVERQLHKYYGKICYGNTVLLYSHMEVISLLGNFIASLLSCLCYPEVLKPGKRGTVEDQHMRSTKLHHRRGENGSNFSG